LTAASIPGKRYGSDKAEKSLLKYESTVAESIPREAKYSATARGTRLLLASSWTVFSLPSEAETHNFVPILPFLFIYPDMQYNSFSLNIKSKMAEYLKKPEKNLIHAGISPEK